MRGAALLATGVAAALCALPGIAGAQTIVGRVLERGGGGPVAGAMVRLETARGNTGVGWLTAADGRFRLRAPLGGTYALRVDRIGFASTLVANVDVPEGGIASIDVVVETEPIVLEGLEVSAAGGRCEPDPAGGGAQVLWDEARKALAAASWTQEQGDLRFVVRTWDRQLSTRTSQILVEETDEQEVVGANSVQSLPPERLLAEGYVHTDSAYSYYYAPDAEVLLSAHFRDTHCFRVVDVDDDAPHLGLEFEPDDDRDLPDVAGVIWLDRQSARLDRVEFRYTGLDVAGASRARGEVRFAELENGRWIVRDWFIQAPLVMGRTGTSGRLGGGVLARIHDVGSSVEMVEGQGTVWAPDVAPALVRGTVFDSIAGRPLAGATIRMAGSTLRAVADLDGRFELRNVRPGLRRITLAHPRLDSIGVTTGWTTVQLEPGDEVDVDLAVPSWLSLLAGSCGPDSEGAVVGYVYERSGAKVSGATVATIDLRTPEGTPFTAISDLEGGYVLCGVPTGVVRVAARRGGTASEVIETRLGGGAPARADLTVRPGPAAAAVPSALRPALVGTVMESSSRSPLEGVVVAVLAADGGEITSTITDAEGSFSVLPDADGEIYLRVSRLGYTGAVSEAIDLRDGTRRIEVLLPEEAIEIDPVIVVVDSRLPRLELVGFYERAVTHPGSFIQMDDVEAVSPARTSDLLGRVPGVRVTTDTSGTVIRRRVLFNRLAMLDGERCYPAVFVDDQLVRMGGSRSESEFAPTSVRGLVPDIGTGEDVPSIDELVPPHEILAVEMYENAARLPGRFVGLGTHCGVIVFWTTRGR